MAKIDELNTKLSIDTSNKSTVKEHYNRIIGKGTSLHDLIIFSGLNSPNPTEAMMAYRDRNKAMLDSCNFFKSNRCIYTFMEMLKIKDVIKVYDNKVYIYEKEFNYWQIQKNNTQIISKLKSLLEEIYELQFKYLEMLGFNINSKLSTALRDIKISDNFKISRLEFEELVNKSSDWINFKNCCYNIENNRLLTEENDRKQYFFDSYVNVYIKYQSNDNEYTIPVTLEEDCPYFYNYFITSLNGDWNKLLQLGQHLIYSIITKNPERKAKQVLFMIGKHDVGKSCLIDLFSSYLPEELIRHIAPVEFGSKATRAQLFNARLNTVHEASAKRTIPISEFNKTVWINSDEAIINGILHKGNYLQLHQVYAGNNFFKVSNEYNPRDYLPKINILVIDGQYGEKINNLSQKIIEEKDYIISYFLFYIFEIDGKQQKLYQKLKNDDFNFIELEDAIDVKSEIQLEYEENILAKGQKKEKKLDTSILDYGLEQFFHNRIQPYEYDQVFIENIKNNHLDQIIKLSQKKVPEEYKIHIDDLYKFYVNYCDKHNLKFYPSSMFKKTINKEMNDHLIIESKIKSGKEIIDYTNKYKKMINKGQFIIMKKFKDKTTENNKIGYIGLKVLED